MTTTIKIKHKLNIQERQNRPHKVKMNYSKVNNFMKTNKTSNIVNLIKDKSQNIIDKAKAKANLFGTPEISVITKNKLELNDEKIFQSPDSNNSTNILVNTIPHRKELNQNKIIKPSSTKKPY